MTPKQEAAMRQALEALEIMKSYGNNFGYRRNERNPYAVICEALDSLREALAEPVQEPVYTLTCVCGAGWDIKPDGTEEMAHPPATGREPVAIHQFRKRGCSDWVDGHPDHTDGGGPYETRTLYAAPPPAQAADGKAY